MLKVISNLSDGGGTMEAFISTNETVAMNIENDLKKYISKIEQTTGGQLVVLVSREKIAHSGPQRGETVHLTSFCDPAGSRDKKLYKRRWEDGFYLLINTIMLNHKTPMAIVKKADGTYASLAFTKK